MKRTKQSRILLQNKISNDSFMEKLQIEPMKHMLSVFAFFLRFFSDILCKVSRYNFLGILTLWSLCINLAFDYINRWYLMHAVCTTPVYPPVIRTRTHTHLHIQIMVLPWPLCHCAQCSLFSVPNRNNLSIDVNITWKIRKGLMNTVSFFSFHLLSF